MGLDHEEKQFINDLPKAKVVARKTGEKVEPVPPAGGEVEVVIQARSVGDRIPSAWADIRDLVDLEQMQRTNALCEARGIQSFYEFRELVDRAHVTRLTAENARLLGGCADLNSRVRELEHKMDYWKSQNDALQSELTKAREFIESVQSVPSSYFQDRLAEYRAYQSAPAEQRIERGLNHGFNQSPNSCRHDHRTGVWWREGNVTRTGRECDACGNVAEDPIQSAPAAKPPHLPINRLCLVCNGSHGDNGLPCPTMSPAAKDGL